MRAHYLRFTPIRRSKGSPASRVASYKVVSSCPIERSRATSPTRSMSSFRSSADQDSATSRKCSKSTVTTPKPTSSITVRSARDRRHPNDDGRKSEHEGHLSQRIHPHKLSSV